MRADFSIDYIAASHVVRYSIHGFWTVEAVDAFIDALVTELSGRAVAGRKPSLLGNAGDFAVQSAPVAKAFEHAMHARVLPRVARLALVVKAVLNKLQVERGVGDSNTAIFLNESDALAWITRDGG